MLLHPSRAQDVKRIKILARVARVKLFGSTKNKDIIKDKTFLKPYLK
jgi:hypothetical protein